MYAVEITDRNSPIEDVFPAPEMREYLIKGLENHKLTPFRKA